MMAVGFALGGAMMALASNSQQNEPVSGPWEYALLSCPVPFNGDSTTYTVNRGDVAFTNIHVHCMVGIERFAGDGYELVAVEQAGAELLHYFRRAKG